MGSYLKEHFWMEFYITGVWLKGMRIMRGKSIKDMQKILRMPYWEIKQLEKEGYIISEIAEIYIKRLNISKHHLLQFEKIFKGELKTFTEGREVEQYIKTEVRKKCKHKCVQCGSKERLHFHHKEHFAKGGPNTVENLVLLCAKCHAEAHKGEKPYYMLLKVAER